MWSANLIWLPLRLQWLFHILKILLGQWSSLVFNKNIVIMPFPIIFSIVSSIIASLTAQQNIVFSLKRCSNWLMTITLMQKMQMFDRLMPKIPKIFLETSSGYLVMLVHPEAKFYTFLKVKVQNFWRTSCTQQCTQYYVFKHFWLQIFAGVAFISCQFRGASLI